jgi:hypothetical protein
MALVVYFFQVHQPKFCDIYCHTYACYIPRPASCQVGREGTPWSRTASTSISPLIRDLGVGSEWSISRPGHLPLGNNHGTHSVQGAIGLESFGEEKMSCSCRNSNCRLSCLQTSLIVFFFYLGGSMCRHFPLVYVQLRHSLLQMTTKGQWLKIIEILKH